MIYLDNAATTFVDDDVLKDFNYACKNYIGNPNSSYRLGKLAKARIDDASYDIARILNVKPTEIVYTSSATEANNLAIKGVCFSNKGKHIITTSLEHSSVIAPLNRLCQMGYKVSLAKLNSDGSVDIEYLKSIITEDTVLVSVVGVDGELGIRQNIEEIAILLKNFPNCYFHVDATQMIGKVKADFSNVDLISFSAHKFFGIKGIGCLIKKDNVKIMPLLDGGKSTTRVRSGTPALELIVSLQKALSLAYTDFDKKQKYVNELSSEIKEFLNSYKDIKLNNTSKSIDNIINFSVKNSSTLIELLADCGVYVSSKSACSLSDTISRSIVALYNDEKRANTSIRISITYKTTRKEIKMFKKIFDTCYAKLGE